jgi:adenylate kinase
MRRVLVTGMSGLGRSQLFEHDLKHQIIHFDLGDQMREIARERALPFSESNILRASSAALAALRAAAIERIFHQLRNVKGENRPAILSAHGLFLLTDRMSEGLSFADVAAIRPDLVITLVDAPQRIHDRLREHSGEYLHLTVESIIRWQEFEVFFANHLAKEKGVPHYVVPVTQPETFLALVSEDPRPTVYASYPMTHLSEEKRPLVREFVRKLGERFIIFDPSAVEGSLAYRPYYSVQDTRAIRNHTIVRDLDWFIGINAQAVVAYWPDLVFSSGMNDELRYAYENGRETYLVAEVTAEGQVPILSPFTTYKNKIFWSSQDFFDYLDLSEPLREAFLLIQREMMDVLIATRDMGGAIDKEEFRRRCTLALTNAKPDGWLAVQGAEIDALAGRIYDRWAPTMAALGGKLAPAGGQ